MKTLKIDESCTSWWRSQGHNDNSIIKLLEANNLYNPLANMQMYGQFHAHYSIEYEVIFEFFINLGSIYSSNKHFVIKNQEIERYAIIREKEGVTVKESEIDKHIDTNIHKGVKKSPLGEFRVNMSEIKKPTDGFPKDAKVYMDSGETGVIRDNSRWNLLEIYIEEINDIRLFDPRFVHLIERNTSEETEF